MVDNQTLLNTRLAKVKSFMDNGSFVFTFNKAKPFAIHEDQLFKNQVLKEIVGPDEEISYVRKASPVVKRERIIEISGDVEEGFGILYDSGSLIIPAKILKKNGTALADAGYVKLTLPIISESINQVVHENKDSVESFGIINNTLVVLTKMNLVYYIKLDNFNDSEERFELKEIDNGFAKNVVYKITSGDKYGKTLKDVNKTNIFVGTYPLEKTIQVVDPNDPTGNTMIDKIIYENIKGFFVKYSSGDLYFYNLEELDKEPVHINGDFKNLKKIYSKYNRTYFLYKEGEIYCIGDNTKGALGTGNSDTVTKLTKLGQNLDISEVDAEKKNIFDMSIFTDIAIGKYHTIFLTDEGFCIGFGSNEQYQLGHTDNTRVFTKDFNIIKTGKIYKIRNIMCTKYGTVCITNYNQLVFCGTFVNGELGFVTKNDDVYEVITKEDGSLGKGDLIKEHEKITIDGIQYDVFLRGISPTLVKRSYVTENGSKALRAVLYVDIANTSGNGVFVYKENGNCEFTGSNKLAVVGFTTESAEKIDVWTSIEEKNNLYREEEERPSIWTYFEDFVMKCDKGSGSCYKEVYYKNHNGVWINWLEFIRKNINTTLNGLTDENGNVLERYLFIYDENKNLIRNFINWKSFGYLVSKKEYENLYKIDKSLIPSVEYIDKNLNVFYINKGDNLRYRIYTEADKVNDNKEYNEILNETNEKIEYYTSLINSEDTDPVDILDYQDKIEELNLKVKELEEKMKANEDKVGTLVEDEFFTFEDNVFCNPLKIVGKENKTINYIHSKFNETITEYNSQKVIDVELETTTINGSTVISKGIKTVESESNITKVKMEFVDKDFIDDPKNNPNNDVARDDIKFTFVDEDEEPDENHTFDEFLVMYNGRFINKDYYTDDTHKSFILKDGLAITDVRRICEHPGFEEPKPSLDINSTPRLIGNSATVNEKYIPTELRWDMNLNLFGWKDIQIEGPYKVHGGSNITSDLGGKTTFLYGDAKVSVYTDIRLTNTHKSKGEFILFMNGYVVPDYEYDVFYQGSMTIIRLKTYISHIVSILQELVDITKPGYKGQVEMISEKFGELQPFSIAFLSTDKPYSKVNLYYDRQNVRNWPKPGQVLFNEINYNDLVLVDGHYVPYLWESNKCVKFVDTQNISWNSENNFVNMSDIYVIKPYVELKNAEDMTEDEIRNFAYSHNLITESDRDHGFVDQIYPLVVNYIKKLKS